MVSGSLDVSNSFVSPYSNSFVSQSGWWCPALPDVSNSFVSPHSICLPVWLVVSGSPDVSNSFVSPYSLPVFICLPVWLVVSGSPDASNSFVSPYRNSFVSQSGWWCPALRHVSNSFVSPYGNSFVSQSGWWCPALCMSPIHLSPLIAIHLFSPVWLVVSGSRHVSNSFVSPYSNSFVSQSGWWCPALRMSPIHLSPLIASHLVWLVVSGSLHVSNSFVFPLWQFICLPFWLVVRPALRLSPIDLFPLIAIHFSQSGWWCLALRMSPIHLSPLIAIHFFPSLAGGARLPGCLQFICLSL